MNHVKEVTIYSPEAQIRTPLRLLRMMIRDVQAARELAWRLFVRDISAQYRQSILGVFWAFVPPVVTSLIFIVLQSQRVINFEDPGIPYPLYVLTGTILWQVFTESLNAPLKSVTQAKPMLAKVSFPYEALVISAIYNVLFGLLIKCIILVVICIYFRVPITFGLILAPLAYVMIILLGIGIGLLLTPLGMLYTDVPTSLPVLSQLWFFLTPVIYPVPERFPFSLLAVINPVSPLLLAARDLTIRGLFLNWGSFIIVGILAILLLPIAWIIYRVSIPILIERISA